jgi:hypothetical protein
VKTERLFIVWFFLERRRQKLATKRAKNR